MELNVNREGGTYNFEYTFTQCSGNKNVSFTKTPDGWYSLEHDTANGKLSVEVLENDGARRNGAISAYVNSEVCETINISQDGLSSCDCNAFYAIPCDCDTLGLTVDIPKSGATSGQVIGTYGFDKGSIECEKLFSIVCHDASIEYSNGEIRVLEDIQPSVNVSKTFTFVIYFKGLECKRIDVIQEPNNFE